MNNNHYTNYFEDNIISIDDLQMIKDKIRSNYKDMMSKYGSMTCSEARDKIPNDMLREIDEEISEGRLLILDLVIEELSRIIEIRGKSSSIFRLLPFLPYYNKSYRSIQMFHPGILLYIDNRYMGRVYYDIDSLSILGYDYEILTDPCRLSVQSKTLDLIT